VLKKLKFQIQKDCQVLYLRLAISQYY